MMETLEANKRHQELKQRKVRCLSACYLGVGFVCDGGGARFVLTHAVMMLLGPGLPPSRRRASLHKTGLWHGTNARKSVRSRRVWTKSRPKRRSVRRCLPRCARSKSASWTIVGRKMPGVRASIKSKGSWRSARRWRRRRRGASSCMSTFHHDVHSTTTKCGRS